mmetsp:Transcript_86171/g.241178  ORF Transcript_86171/g.241178 Transcript_86171/m.241178 type:complete len:261 (+) Transcript_86171:63-845(+)
MRRIACHHAGCSRRHLLPIHEHQQQRADAIEARALETPKRATYSAPITTRIAQSRGSHTTTLPQPSGMHRRWHGPLASASAIRRQAQRTPIQEAAPADCLREHLAALVAMRDPRDQPTGRAACASKRSRFCGSICLFRLSAVRGALPIAVLRGVSALVVRPRIIDALPPQKLRRHLHDQEKPVHLQAEEGIQQGHTGPLRQALREVPRSLDVGGPAHVGVHHEAGDEEHQSKDLEQPVGGKLPDASPGGLRGVLAQLREV